MSEDPPPPLTCPTTGQRFAPCQYRLQRVRGHCFVWVWCPLCDAHGRRYDDPGFDPMAPQIHCVELLLGRELGGGEALREPGLADG